MDNKAMQQNLKKYFYSGIGYVAHTADAVKNSAKEISGQSKRNETDGRRIIEHLFAELESRYNEVIKKIAAASTSELAVLNKRVSKIEKGLQLHNSPTRRPSASLNHVVTPVKHPVKDVKHAARPVKKAVRTVERAAVKSKSAVKKQVKQ